MQGTNHYQISFYYGKSQCDTFSLTTGHEQMIQTLVYPTRLKGPCYPLIIELLVIN